MRNILILASLLWIGAAGATDREFRVFAVAYKHELSRVSDYASFDAAIRELFVAQIAPRLRRGVPNLVTFPENQTLMAYLLGARGSLSRELLEPDGAIPGIASLAAPYAPQLGYYAAKFPGVDSPGQLLQLALTDTLARLIMETFGELAAEYAVYLTVSSNLAAFELATEPAAELLRDPEVGEGPAYEATAPEVFNRNFLFGPTGRLLTIQDKAYLVPIERERAAGLGLTGIAVDQLRVFDLPFARIATVISKDAWMVDVNDRLDQLDAELLIQSEAFSSWGVSGDDLWPPDKFQRGGWWMLQKHPALAVNATPMLTGNFGDLTFDGQALIAVSGPAGDSELCLMGQAPEPGWAAVGGWSNLSDAPSALCDPGLRTQLAERARQMLPGSGDGLENAYAQNVVFADIRLPASPAGQPRIPRRGGPASWPVAGEGSQLQPRLAAAGSGAWLSWIDFRDPARQLVFVSQSDTAGRFDTGRALAAPAARAFDHFDNQWAPALAPQGERLHVGWLSFATENWDLLSAQLDPAGAVSEPQRVDDADHEAGTLRERGHSSPVLLAGPDGDLLAVWSDLRWPYVKPQIRLARTATGTPWSPSWRADGQPLNFEARQLDARDPHESRGQAFPTAAFDSRGTLFVAWQEADLQGQPGIYLVQSLDTVLRFSAPRRVSADTAAYRPQLAVSGQQVHLLYEQRTGRGGMVLMHRRLANGTWSAARRLDPSAALDSVQRHARPLIANNELIVVFEDQRAADADVLWMRLGDAEPRRVDDGPAGSQARVPTATVVGSDLLVAWQDDREGPEKLRTTRISLASGGNRIGGPLSLLLLGLLAWAGLNSYRYRP